MTQGPTTINGPLHTPEADTGAQRVVAYFANRQHAEATRFALIDAGISEGQISVLEVRAERIDLEPTDKSLIGQIREALLPDDGQTGKRDAIADNDVVLRVWPQDGEADRIVDIIQASNPHHFDPALERWRNSPPTT
ncbi:hypothetical protein [Acidisphaera sp. L21]|uniref:hypothetical protein n=1 Tax=Acidisphaera sp. L21 TaxID=1641851 RepID=UPI00131A6FFC|nr:hypothetical protein [Acidisphaera sp. L21]